MLQLQTSHLLLLIEVIAWILIFLKCIERFGFYRSLIISNFIVSTIDIILFLSFNLHLFTINIIHKKTGSIILRLPVTLSFILFVKSILFYLVNDYLPSWIREKIEGEK